MTIQTLLSQVRKSTAAKLLTVGLLAGAVALAVPAKADAQGVVLFAGNPHPVYARYDRFRAEEFRREEWRAGRFDHGFYARPYARPYAGRYDRRFYR